MLTRTVAITVLAITACGKDGSAPKREPSAGSAEPAMSLDERASQYEREEPQRVAARRALFGTEPAGLSGPLAKVVFGAPTPADIQDTFRAIRDATELSVDGSGVGRVEMLAFKPTLLGPDAAQKFCDMFRREIAGLWGAPIDGVWVGAKAGRRAYFMETYPCELVVEPFTTPAAWISKAASSIVPMAEVGKPSAPFGTKLHDRIETAGTPLHTEWTWNELGLAGGKGQTDLTAHVIKGKIAWVEARVLLEPAGVAALTAHLTALLGKPSEDGEWASKPPVSLFVNGDVTTVTVGDVQDD